MAPRPTVSALFATLALLFGPSQGAAGHPSDAAARLATIIDEYERWVDDQYPEQAITRRRPTAADRITDASIRGYGMRTEHLKIVREDLQAIDPSQLPPADRIDRELLLRELELGIRSFDFGRWLAPVDARNGPQIEIPQFADHVAFERPEDYVNYAKRFSAVPQSISDIDARLREGRARGILPPMACMEGVLQQFDAVLASKLQSTGAPLREAAVRYGDLFAAPLLADWERDRGRALDALATLRTSLEQDYLPSCRATVGCWDAPDGAAYYAFELSRFTTTDLTPDQVHALGLSEVARIRAEMLEVIARTDWAADPARAALEPDARFAAFIAYLRSEPRFYHTSAQELLAGYRDICKRVDAELPRYFKVLPRCPYGVREIPRFMAPQQTTAYYMPGSIAGGLPGWFYANTFALDQRPTYEMIPLALHEAVPGHHLQIMLAEEMTGSRHFRKGIDSTAFVEGWALYSERIGIDMGFFRDDPYADFGRLLYEMWRATRLVVDTGIHHLRWERRQAIDFMKANTALSELNIAREVDRYIAWPGQACAYKIGELCIRGLRQEAEAALTDRFDIRGFHDAVLGAGPLPLPLLETRVREWIAAEAAAANKP
jgi:prolyl oligopeptidase